MMKILLRNFIIEKFQQAMRDAPDTSSGMNLYVAQVSIVEDLIMVISGMNESSDRWDELHDLACNLVDQATELGNR